MERAFRAVRRSEVAVLVLDAGEGVTQQDFRLAEYIVSLLRMSYHSAYHVLGCWGGCDTARFPRSGVHCELAAQP